MSTKKEEVEEAKRNAELLEVAYSRATIQLDIPFLKLKRVLELLSKSGEITVSGSNIADCDGEDILNVYLN